MCAGLDGVRDMAAAAEALTEACVCHIDSLAPVLRLAFGDASAGLPDDMLALLARLDGERLQ